MIIPITGVLGIFLAEGGNFSIFKRGFAVALIITQVTVRTCHVTLGLVLVLVDNGLRSFNAF